jgi:cell wall-associated NlpC family hydrolase
VATSHLMRRQACTDRRNVVLTTRAADLGILVLLAAVASGCAVTTTAARPTAFPGHAAAGPRPLADAVLANAVVTRALALRGIPYRLGGDRPETGLDCSGLVRYVFLESQIRLPRTVAEQFVTGVAVDEGDIQMGDLLFFDTVDPGPSHVGIALDDGTFVHAPGSGGFVRLERLATPYWSSRLRGVRRVAVADAKAVASAELR